MHKLNYLILNLWIHLAKFEAWIAFWTDKHLFKLMGLLKRLGHAILGNFSIDQVVIELTEITR